MRISRKNGITGEYERIEITSWSAIVHHCLTHGIPREHLPSVFVIAYRCVVLGTVVFVANWALAAGWPPARADDIKKILIQLQQDHKERLQERLERLEIAIFEARSAQCKADGAARTQYAERLNELVRRYYAVSPRPPQIPRCDET